MEQTENANIPQPNFIVEQKSSFNLKQTAKGGYYWDIKIYSENIDEIKTKIKELNDWAAKEYGGIGE